MTDRSGFPLADELERRFADGVRAHWSEGEFNALALRAFALQFDVIPAFQGFCRSRGRTPATVSSWRDVPVVPVTAFKHMELCVGEAEIVFRTSGTTRGAELRGNHLVPRVSLYRASLLPPFETYVLADPAPKKFLSLVPSPKELSDSSLSFMVAAAAETFADSISWLVDGAGRLDEDGLRTALREAAHSGEPVLLLSTALALLHVLERLEAAPVDPVPEGSRLMETGGFKGLGREVGRAELYERVGAAFGIPRSRVVSEYGMTELLSQLYEPVLSEGPQARVHVAPPWLKVRALDPTTLEEVPSGEEGLLSFFDLANVGSICHVLTEDLGTVSDGRVRLHGRVQGAEPRGCSRAMDELMTAAGSTR